MIDTIVLRLHNIDKYPLIREQFEHLSENAHVVEVGVNTDGSVNMQTKYRLHRWFSDNNKFVPFTYRSDMRLASNHYTVSYNYDGQKFVAEFNFSIPKYLYGSNVQQFIDVFDQSHEVMFTRLRNFLWDFLTKHLASSMLDDDIEINRIDLCYNQFFDNKEQALQYLEEQHRMAYNQNKKGSKNKFRSYDTTVMFNTEQYSFKIYHKGTEFKKKDMKQIMKFQTTKKLRDMSAGAHMNIPVGYLAEQADRVLRYEMTFRRSMIKYLVDQKIMYSKKAALDERYKNHVLRRFTTYLAGSVKDSGIARENRKGKKTLLDTYKSAPKMFTLGSMFDTTRDPYILIEEEKITFDKDIFGMLYDAFFKKLKDYQLYQVTDLGDLALKLGEISVVGKAKKAMEAAKAGKEAKQEGFKKDSTRLMLLALVSAQGLDLSVLRDYIPERTYFRLKKEAKELGIGTRTTNLSFPMPRTDYTEYKLAFRRMH